MPAVADRADDQLGLDAGSPEPAPTTSRRRRAVVRSTSTAGRPGPPGDARPGGSRSGGARVRRRRVGGGRPTPAARPGCGRRPCPGRPRPGSDSSSTRSAGSTSTSTSASWPSSRSSLVVKAVYAGPRRPSTCTSVTCLAASEASTSSAMSVAASSAADLISTRATSRATLPAPTTTRAGRAVQQLLQQPARGRVQARPVDVGVDVGMAAVPGHELGRGDAAGQVLARDAEPPVAAGAVGVDHRVDAGRAARRP